MPIKDKIFYNVASANQLKWSPQWFGEDEIDDEFIKKVKEYQKIHGLVPDGLVGPKTYKSIYTELEAKQALVLRKFNNSIQTDKKYVYCNSKPVEIAWDKVITFKDENGFKASQGTYRKAEKERKVNFFCCHWDCALSSKSCYSILERRKLSVQLSIDNDGTIYQFLDLNDIAQQAGSNNYGSWNNESIGVEITNAIEIKYQQYYEKMGFGSRPLYKNVSAHNKFYGTILGFYPIQLEALKVLLSTVCKYYNIPLICPTDQNGKYLTKVYGPIVKHKWSGVCSHLNLTTEKWDCAGLDLVKLLSEIS